jgi:hypothetical protein
MAFSLQQSACHRSEFQRPENVLGKSWEQWVSTERVGKNIRYRKAFFIEQLEKITYQLSKKATQILADYKGLRPVFAVPYFPWRYDCRMAQRERTGGVSISDEPVQVQFKSFLEPFTGSRIEGTARHIAGS